MNKVLLAEDVFLEIPDDPENVILQLPPDIWKAAGFEVGDNIMVEKTEDGSLKITKEKKYIYESPDNGETVYRREFGSTEREIVVKPEK